MTSNSTKTRFAAVTARLLVLLIAACMLLAVAPRLTEGFVFRASAELPNITTNSVSEINAFLNNNSGEVNVMLSGNVTLDGTIVIPGDSTVNFYLNGCAMNYTNNSWQLMGYNAITNNGTLNLYSGSVSKPDLANGTGSINLANNRTEMNISENEHAYARLDGIINSGTLNVGKNVAINVTNYVGYKDQSAQRGSCTVAATGIYNTFSAAVCNINGTTIEVLAQSHAITERTKDEIDHGRAFSYGIYGGTVSVAGASDIHTNAYARMACANTAISNKENGCLITVAYNIASNGNITVTGGSFRYDTSHACNQAVTDKGTSWCYQGGICYSGAAPTIIDGTFSTPSGSTGLRGNTKIYREAVVTYASVLPYSGYDLFCSNSTPGTGYNGVYETYNEPSNPVNDVSAGQYKDECDNTYDATLDTTDNNTHPAKIVRGAFDGTYRVHVVYRYWTDITKSTVDTNVVGSDGNVGYSYKPLGDGTNIVQSSLTLIGLSGGKLVKTQSSGVSYGSGGDSKNDYYWKKYNLASDSASTWFSDYDVTSSSHRGTEFKSFINATPDTSAGAGSSDPLYVFVDYYRVSPTTIKGVVTNNTATVTYTGNPIKASSFNLRVIDAVYSYDYSDDYNLDFTEPSKIPVTFSWHGATLAGTQVQNAGELPVDAGTYTVTLQIADSDFYDPHDCDPATHKNRITARDYEFTLVIQQANVARGSLPESVSLTYGETLGEKLTLDGYVARGPLNEAVEGRYSFANSQEGNVFKNVGTGTVAITWAPTYAVGASTKNYRETTFTVSYTVSPASLVISPKNAQVVYGETTFDTPFYIAVNGLAGNDNTSTTIDEIAASIDYMIMVNGAYVYYNPDEINVGTYPIRARVRQADIPDVLSNYTYSYADLVSGYEVNQLTVAKRGLTVKATAVSRAYQPDNYNVNLTYELISGRYGADDVRFVTGVGQGSINPNTAGTQVVYGATVNNITACMTGAKADNYQVTTVTYATGDTLTVEITKAVPDAVVPTVDDMYYQRGRTLHDIALSDTASSVEGEWRWADESVNPSVNVKSYAAKFVPDDAVNYAEKPANVTINVLPTPVKITYNNTVEYGDPVPNITAYTYTSEQDPTFSSEGLVTTGNITPSTTYREGSAVSAEGYPVTFTLMNYADAAGNYVFTAQDGKIVVTPRNIEFTVPNAVIEYGENYVPTAQNVVLSYDASRLVGTDTINSITESGTEPTWNYSTSYTYQSNYQVGSYQITAEKSFNTSPNYTVSVVNGTLTVTKAPLTIRANNVTLAYNSDIPANLGSSYSLIGAKRNEQISAILTSGEITVDTNYYKGASVNAEGYSITVNTSQAEFRNYTVSVENGKITVIKATPVVRSYPTASIVYGQTLADAVFTGGVIDDDVPGAFAYNAASTKPAYSNEPYTNYTATFIPTDTTNYNTVTGLSISLTVNKMPISGALAVSGIPMLGETLTVDVSGLNPNTEGAYTYTWKMGETTVGTGTTLSLVEAYVGHEIVVTAVAQGYYVGDASYTITEIAPELHSVAEIIKADVYSDYFTLTGLDNFGGTSTVAYDARQKGVTLLQNEDTLSSVVVGTITVKYNGSTEIPVNAGLYTVTVDVATPDLERVDDVGVTTYSPATGLVIGTLQITKAPYNVVVTVGDKVYDGTNTAYAASVDESGAMDLEGGAKDDVAFDADRAVYTFADANVGSNKDVNSGNTALTGSSAANYELSFSLADGGKASVTPRTLDVSVAPVAREYQVDNYDVDLSFIVNTSTIAPADTSANVYVNEALAVGTVDDYHAGTRRVSVSNVALAGNKAGNYTLNITNLDGLTVEIQKATPSYPLPNTGIVYYDSGRTLSNISLGDSRWAWADTFANVIPTAGNHSYTAVYTPDDMANYASVEYEVALNVKKAPVVIKAASFTILYGDYAPTYYYTATGLTGADTIKTSVGGYVIMTCSYQPGSDIGTYDIVLSGGFTSDNYSFTYQKGSITVNPRPVYVTAIAESREYEPGNLNVNVTFSELSNVYSGDASNVYLGGTQPVVGTIADDNAGTKTVTYEMPALSGAKADNYTLKLTNPELKVEIAKAILDDVVLPTSGVVKYGAKLSTTEFTSSYDSRDLGTFSMENPMSTPAAVGTFSDVYKVVFTPNNTINYATITEFITLTVENSALNVELSLSGSAEVGKKLYVSTNSLPADAYENIEFRWYRMDSRTGDIRDGKLLISDTMEYTVTESDAGHYIVCVATSKAGSPYNIDSRVSTDNTVSNKSMSLWERILKWFYRVIASITQLFGKI